METNILQIHMSVRNPMVDWWHDKLNNVGTELAPMFTLCAPNCFQQTKIYIFSFRFSTFFEMTKRSRGIYSCASCVDSLAHGICGSIFRCVISHYNDVMMASKAENASIWWPFVWGIHRSPVDATHKRQWRGSLMFSLIWAWINRWVQLWTIVRLVIWDAIALIMTSYLKSGDWSNVFPKWSIRGL